MNNYLKKTAKRSLVISWIGAFLILFGGIFAFAGRLSITQEQAYESKGAKTQGTIVGKHSEDSWKTDSETKRRTKTTTYYLQYSFKPDQGEIINSRDSVPSDVYNTATTGSPIEIQYIPSDLSKNRIAGANDYTFGLVFLGIGSLIIIVGASLIAFDFKKRKLFNRLINEGMLVEATILSVAPGNLSINDVLQWRIGYSFKDMRGQERKGSSPHLPPQQAQNFRIGDTGKVKYDKDNSNLSIWIGN